MSAETQAFTESGGGGEDVVEFYEIDDADVLQVSDEISVEFHDAYVRLSDLP